MVIDAPWIREAEIYGDGGKGPIPVCPVCEAEDVLTFYVDENSAICGCDRCIRVRDAAEWMRQRLEDGRIDAEERKDEW